MFHMDLFTKTFISFFKSSFTDLGNNNNNNNTVQQNVISFRPTNFNS